MVVVVMMVMVVMTMRSRPDADVNAGAVMVVMMVTDHDLGGPGATALRQTLVVGFQQREGVRDRIEKVAIAGGARKLRPARRRRLGSGHRAEGCGRSQQAG
jgi:hypothetical protein